MLSHALHARFADTAEQRASDRRVLRLDAQADTPAGKGGILIHNLSRTGMLVESDTRLPVGTRVEIEMPGGARHRAEVVWRDAGLFGCRFTKPLSQATLSAALLRSAPLVEPPADVGLVVDQDALARLRQHWQFEHELSPTGEQGLPLGKRLWTIIGLGLVSWAVPTALLIWLLS